MPAPCSKCHTAICNLRAWETITPTVQMGVMQFELLGKLLRVTEEDSHPAVIRTHLFLPPKAHLPLPPSYHFLWNPQGTPGSSGFLWFL